MTTGGTNNASPHAAALSLPNDAIANTIARAFKPFNCVVQIRLEHNQLRFKVLNRTAPIFTEAGIALDDVQDTANLIRMIAIVRRKLAAKGYSFEPWTSSESEDR